MKWSIGTKIGSGFGGAVIILVILGSLAFVSISRLIESSQRVDQVHSGLWMLKDLLGSVTELESSSRGYALTGDARYLTLSTDVSATVDGLLDQLFVVFEDPLQRSRTQALRPLVDEKLLVIAETIEARKTGGQAAVDAFIAGNEGKDLMDDLRRLAADIEADALADLGALEHEARQQATRTKMILLVGILLTMATIAVGAVRLGKHVAEPLADITRIAGLISQGDLSASIPKSDRQDEIGVLIRTFASMKRWLDDMSRAASNIAKGDLVTEVRPVSGEDVLGNAFATMRESLRHTTEELQEASNTLASSASEILAATTQMAASAGETAASIAQTTTTVEEVKQTAQLSSDKSRAVSDAAQNAVKVARDGSRAVAEALASMERIRDQVESVAETVVRLSEQSQAIGDIVGTVAELAEQSNLLAVNAAIEAARAGEHGKGFGVVAQEVRSLAEQSKEATTQVRAILSETQQAISSVVLATEQGSKTVEAGIQQSGEAGESIRLLAEVIEDGADAAFQIAASSHQQAVGIDQISAAMQSIKQASTQNVSGARQTEIAARNLHELGLKLKDLLQTYRT